MAEHAVMERRTNDRIELTTFCPTTFEYQGRTFQALMVNVSESGARFELGAFFTDLNLKINDELSLSIKTPYGMATCSGTVCWIEMRSDTYCWGIEFSSQLYNAHDHLWNLIDSPY